VKRGFPLGAAISGSRLTGTSDTDKKYQKFFYDNFNWAAAENDMKWRLMEGTEVKLFPTNKNDAFV
jgi:hypothetical protein